MSSDAVVDAYTVSSSSSKRALLRTRVRRVNAVPRDPCTPELVLRQELYYVDFANLEAGFHALISVVKALGRPSRGTARFYLYGSVTNVFDNSI